MSAQDPLIAGWYPDPDTGGTRYWDGSRWSGARRPRRRAFAAKADYGWEPHYFTLMGGVSFGAIWMMAAFDEGFHIGWFVGGMALLLGSLAVSIYFLRGQGPTTKDVEEALAARRAAEEKAWTKAAKMRRRGWALFGTSVAAPDVVGAAQVNAVANPATARALQNLQNLLYTQALSDAEFQRAKEKVLGADPATNDSFAQIARLVELHRAGVLSDFEFAAAKARALDL